MTLLITKLKEISIFFYTLILLLIFNLYFNLNFNWDGITIIVRVYIWVLSFYLVYIFASLDTNQLKNQYTEKYKKKGNLILFIEIRVIPFLIIYLVTILFTLIDQVRDNGWPWNTILSLLNGRYSNNIIFSWLLLLILKFKKNPSIMILLFVSIVLIYSRLDKFIYSTLESGIAISIIKLLKIAVFLFFLFSEFYNNIFKSIKFSLILSLFIFLSTIGSFVTIFKFTKNITHQNKEAGLILLRMGFTYPLEKLRAMVLESSDCDLLKNLLSLSEQYNIDINYSKEEWEYLLLSGSVETADFISEYIMNKNIDLSYEKIISYAEEKSKDESNILENAVNFIKISSKYYTGHEKDFLDRLKISNKSFKLWGMSILAENKSIESIPLLLHFTTDINESIVNSAYNALTIITEMDPAETLDKRKNDPDIISIFKKYYLKYSPNSEIN